MTESQPLGVVLNIAAVTMLGIAVRHGGTAAVGSPSAAELPDSVPADA
ncbi:hypothetical protein [Kitasatospora sp. NPDC004531]